MYVFDGGLAIKIVKNCLVHGIGYCLDGGEKV